MFGFRSAGAEVLMELIPSLILTKCPATSQARLINRSSNKLLYPFHLYISEMYDTLAMLGIHAAKQVILEAPTVTLLLA